MTADSASKPAQPDQEFLTVKQTAEYLNISASIVYRLCVAGKLSHYRFGAGSGGIRIRVADLQEFVQHCKVEKGTNEPGAEAGRQVGQSGSKLVYFRLDLRPKHPCGAVTKAGTPCTHRTKDRHCHQHRKSEGAPGERHEELLEWVGGSFEPDTFDPAAATRRMKKGLPDWRRMM